MHQGALEDRSSAMSPDIGRRSFPQRHCRKARDPRLDLRYFTTPVRHTILTIVTQRTHWRQCMTATEPQLNKPFHEKVFVFLGVVGPLIATVYAITQLWQRYVNWSDIAL